MEIMAAVAILALGIGFMCGTVVTIEVLKGEDDERYKNNI